MKALKEAEDHSCHCAHLVIAQTKIALVEKLAGMALVGAFAVAGTLLASYLNRHVSVDPAPSSSSERLFMDRVNKPDRPQEER